MTRDADAPAPQAPAGPSDGERVDLPGGCYARNYIGMWAVYDDRHQRLAVLRGEDEARALAAAFSAAAFSAAALAPPQGPAAGVAAPTPGFAPSGDAHQATIVGVYSIEALLRGEDVVTDRVTLIPASDIANERHTLVKDADAPAAGAGLAGVDLGVVEGALALYGKAEKDLEYWSHRLPDNFRKIADERDAAHTAVLDAVRDLLKPPADVAGFVDAYRDAVTVTVAADALGRTWDEAKQNDLAEATARSALDAGIAALARGAHGGSAGVGVPDELPRWCHVKRGRVYEEVGRAELQVSNPPVLETDVLVIYRGEDGKLWAREEREFEDGRFARIEAEDRARPADLSGRGDA